MGIALQKAISLIVSADAELLNILRVTAQMSLKSSLIALLLGVPLGIWLGDNRFPGRGVLLVLNRTLMGMPPVVCGLLFYMLFSGVGPFRHLKLLFTVKIMILAQVFLITPIVVGAMETYVAGISPAIRETARGLGLKMVFHHIILSSGFFPLHCRGGSRVHGGRCHCLENQCDDHGHHAVYQSGEFFPGNCAGNDPAGAVAAGQYRHISSAKEAQPMIIPGFTKTYGRNRVLNFPGMEFTLGNN